MKCGSTSWFSELASACPEWKRGATLLSTLFALLSAPIASAACGATTYTWHPNNRTRVWTRTNNWNPGGNPNSSTENAYIISDWTTPMWPRANYTLSCSEVASGAWSATPGVPFSSVTMTSANPGVITWNAHGLTAGTPVVFTSTGALPTNLAPGTTYYVLAPTANTFNVATAPGGTAIDTTAGTQSGTHTATVTTNTSTVTISIASPGVVTWTNHGLSAGKPVSFSTTGTLPTGITAGRTYYVVAPAANTFNIATAPSGTAINTSGSQSGTHTALASASILPPSATITVTIASPAVVSWTGHGLSAGALVRFVTTGALPTGLTAGNFYYVASSPAPTANTFSVTTNPGLAAINTSGSQSGTHTGLSSYSETIVGDYFRNTNPDSLTTDPYFHIIMGGSSTQTFDNVDDIDNLSISNATTVQLPSEFTINGAFALAEGTGLVQVQEGLTLSNPLVIPASATLEIQSGATLIARQGITVNGVLKVKAGAQVLIGNGQTLQVAAGGVLQLLGTAGNVAYLDAENAGSNTFTLNVVGSINANYFSISRTTAAGLNVTGTVQTLSNGDFHYIASSGYAVTLNTASNMPVPNPTGLGFFDDGNSNSLNFNATSYTGTSFSVSNWSGLVGGASFEVDPSNKITWGSQAAVALQVTNQTATGNPPATIVKNSAATLFSTFAFSLTGSGAATDLTALTLTLTGLSTASDLNYAQVFNDTNGNCQYDAGVDTQIGSNLSFSGTPPFTSLSIPSSTVTVPNPSSSATISIATPGVVTWASHGLTAGSPLRFSTTGSLPTGLTAGTVYYVAGTPTPTADTFSVSATYGGAAINTSGAQSGTHTALPSPKCVHVLLATAQNAFTADTLQVSIQNTADVTNSQGYSFSNAGGPPIATGTSTITGVAIKKWNGGNGPQGGAQNWNAANTDWNSPTAPASSDDCQIGPAFSYPIVNIDVTCTNLILPSAGKLDFNSTTNTVTVLGALSVGSGYRFLNAATGNLAFASTTSNQRISANTPFPGNVTINNTAAGGIVTIDNNWTIVGNLTLTAGTLYVSPGVTLTVLGNLSVNGGTLDIAGGGKVVLGDGKNLAVGAAGTLKMIGTAGAPAMIDCTGPVYYVANTPAPATNTFSVASSPGGAAVATSGSQSGTHTAVADFSGSSTITMTIATPAVVTWSSHGLAAETPVTFTSTGALPTGISSSVPTTGCTTTIDGTIKAQYYAFSKLGLSGVTVNSGAMIDPTYYLQNGSFTKPIVNNTAMLTLNRQVPGNALSSMTFDKSGSSNTGVKSIVTGAAVAAGTLTVDAYTGDLTNCCTTYTGYVVSWGTATNTVDLTLQSSAPALVNLGDTLVTVANFKFKQTQAGASYSNINLKSVKLTLTGTGSGSDVSGVRLFYDPTCSGSGGTQIGNSQTFSGSPPTVTFSGIADGKAVVEADATSPPSRCLYTQFDIASSATLGNTVGAQIASSNDVTNTTTATRSDSVTITIASPGVVTWTGHGLPAGAAVSFTTTGALPTGISASTTYYIASSPAPTANTFSLALTSGGAAINTSGTQSGVHTITGPRSYAFNGSFAPPVGGGNSIINGNTITWLGGTSIQWWNGANWNLGRVPNSSDNCVINSATRAPTIGSLSSTVTMTSANPGVITWTAHGLSAGTPVVFATTGALPTNIVAGTTYFIAATPAPTANTFSVAASQGGTAINTTAGTQSGVHTIATKVPSTTVTLTIASPSVVTWTGHGLAAGTAVMFTTTGDLPTGLSPDTVYYVAAAPAPTANTFSVAATAGGSAINTSGSQSGTHSGFVTRPTSTVTMTIASPSVITWTSHGLSAGTPVTFSTTGALPTGIVAGTTYYVAAAPAPAANTFSVAATAGGAAINTSGSQSGTHTATVTIPAPTVTMTIANPAVVTWTAHGLLAGTPIKFLTTGALPTGIVAGTTYYIAASPAPTANTFSVASTNGGAAIVTSGSQSGTHSIYRVAECKSLTIGNGNLSMMTGQNLDVFGSYTNTGTFTESGVSFLTIRDNGSTATNQTLLSSSPIARLAFNKTAGGFVYLDQPITIKNFQIPTGQSFTFNVRNGDILTLPNAATISSGTFQVDDGATVQINSGQTFLVNGGTLKLNGVNDAYPQTLSNKGLMTHNSTGTWSLQATSGTLDLTGFVFDWLDCNGMQVSGTASVTNFSGGQFLDLPSGCGSGNQFVFRFNSTGTLASTADNVGFNWGPSNIPPTPTFAYSLLSATSGGANQTMTFTNWFGDFYSGVNQPDPATKITNKVTAPTTTFVMTASASPVALTQFTATPYDQAVVLKWTTGLEWLHQGFNVYRSTSPDTGFAQINGSLLRNPMLGGSVHGKYEFRDIAVANDVTYYYRLEDISVSGKRTFHGPISATPLALFGAPPAPDSSAISQTGSESHPPSPVPAQESGKKLLAPNVTLLAATGRSLRIQIDVPPFTTAPLAGHAPYQSVRIPGYSVLNDAGRPELPVRTILIEVEGATSATWNTVRSTGGVTAPVDVAPAPRWEVTEAGLGPVFSFDAPFYSVDQTLPSVPITLGEIVEDTGRYYLPIRFEPLKYNPVAHQVTALSQIVFDVFLDGTPQWNVGGAQSDSGPWGYEGALRIHVKKAGLYELRFDDLVSAGVEGPFDAADVTRLRLFSSVGELPLEVRSTGGSFVSGDSIRFFVPYFDGPETDRNTLMLIVDSAPGLRMRSLSAVPIGALSPQASFERRLQVKTPRFGLFSETYSDSDDHIFSSKFYSPPANPGDDRSSFTVSLPHLANTGSVAVLAYLKGSPGQSIKNVTHHVRLYVNSVASGDDVFQTNDAHVSVFRVPIDRFVEGKNSIEVAAVGDYVSNDYDIMSVEHLTVNYPHAWMADSGVADVMSYRVGKDIRVGGFSIPSVAVYDITSAGTAAVLTGHTLGSDGLGGYEVEFASGTGRRFWVVEDSAVDAPALIELNRGSDLRSISHRADVLYIGPSELLDAVRPLARYRESEGFRTALVDTRDIYLEFGNGIRSSAAIKNFIQYAYTQWQAPAPKYIVFVGDGTYDPKNQLSFNPPAGVPIHLKKGQYVDFASDHWFVAFDEAANVPSLALGRIPGSSPDRIAQYVEKVLAYEQGTRRPTGTQAARFSLLSDVDQLGGEHFRERADQLVAQMSLWNPAITIEHSSREMLGDAAFREKVFEAFGSGSQFVHYMGHGAEDRWAGGGVFTNADADTLTNATLPVVVAMNCLNGYFYDADPSFQSLADRLLFNPNGGSIAVWASTSLTSPDAQDAFQRSVYQLTARSPGARLGDLIRLAKVQGGITSGTAEVVDSWTLFGDPMLRILTPEVPSGEIASGISISGDPSAAGSSASASAGGSCLAAHPSGASRPGLGSLFLTITFALTLLGGRRYAGRGLGECRKRAMGNRVLR